MWLSVLINLNYDLSLDFFHCSGVDKPVTS